MKRLIILATLILGTISGTMAQKYNCDENIKIWDNSSAPHSNHLSGVESSDELLRIGNTSSTELYMYYADAQKSTGQAILVCPGGGYQIVALLHEGLQVGEWLAKNGITVGVLKYRMPNGECEVPMEDAVEALKVMRKMASEHNYSADSVGIMGFSAGGHLAASVSNLTSGENRPNFSVLFYPVISVNSKITHLGSRNELIGKDASAELVERYSLEKQVSSSTPATFLVLSDDDTVVNPLNSSLYYSALKQLNIKASMHIYPSGGHGWGMNEDFRYRTAWQSALLDWLTTI